MLFDKNEVKALMQVYAELCFSKIQFEHQISLTSNLVLHVDGANEYTYTLNDVILSKDKETWCPSKQDSSMQTEPSDTPGNGKQNTVNVLKFRTLFCFLFSNVGFQLEFTKRLSW